jgi:hypothetical protein
VLPPSAIGCPDHLIGLHKCFVEVSVYCLQSVGVTQNHIIAVASGFIVGETYLSVEGGIDRIVGSDCEVDAFVHSAELGAISVIGCHLAGNRHAIAGHINYLCIGYIRFLERIHTLAVPALGVDVRFRL